PWWRRALPFAATAAITASVVGSAFVVRRAPATPEEIVRFSLVPDAAAPFFRAPNNASFTISHDGRTLQFLAARLRAPPPYLRRLDQRNAVPIAGGQRAFGPFLSPDDQWVGFVDSSLTIISKIPVTGGEPLPVVRVKTVIDGAAWLEDRTI